MCTSTRFNLNVNCACSRKRKTPRQASFYFFSSKKLVLVFILKEVKPSPDSKMIKLLILLITCCFPAKMTLVEA